MKDKIKKFSLREIIIAAVLLMLLVNVFKSWVRLNLRLQFIKDAKIKLVEEEKKQENLQRELAKTQTNDFIEKEAREKLNMTKDGEFIIMLPTPMLPISPTPTPIDEATNVEKWISLFL